MFSGIIQAKGQIIELKKDPHVLTYGLEPPIAFLEGLKEGASVSVDGVCQTVVSLTDKMVWFEAIQETLQRTTLKHLLPGSLVNVERSLRFGEEIGSHILSGHIEGVGSLLAKNANRYEVSCPDIWMKYLFLKGSIAIDGVSLTISSIDFSKSSFTVDLIPETLKRTTLASKQIGDGFNIEIDSQTKIIVETLERTLKKHPSSFFS